jgi:flagellar biosynthesis protein FlhG
MGFNGQNGQRLKLNGEMTNMLETTAKKRPKIWAIGGGKGGVGKSLVSVLLSMELARRNLKTVLVDVDLGAANLHTLMGIKTPVRTLNDFVIRRCSSIEEICIHTDVQNLRLVCGASEILSLANPQFAQKNKIVQSILQLSCDHVILDLGAGTSYNVLDFFLIAHHPIVVLTPQPISIQNAYAFVRNAVYRKLSRMATNQPSLQELIKMGMDPKNESRMRTIPDLIEAIRKRYDKKMAGVLEKTLGEIKPLIITNMARDDRDNNAGKIIQLVAEKYLTIQAQDLGAIAFDPMIDTMVCQMMPLSELAEESSARMDAGQLIKRLV